MKIKPERSSDSLDVALLFLSISPDAIEGLHLA